MSNWFFHWIGGGYNTVQAETKAEALVKATALGRPTFPGRVTLIPDERTLVRDDSYARTFAEDERYRGMFD